MKKFKILFVVAIFTASFLPTQISAKVTPNEKITIEYLENGYYIETIITEIEASDIMMSRATSSKSGIKTVAYKNGSDETLWSVSVNASFTYTGMTSTCINAGVTTTCPSKLWKVSDAIAMKNGNSATAYATGKRYGFGMVLETINGSAKLTCSANGTLY